MADSALVFFPELKQFCDWLIALARVCNSTSIDVLLTYPISPPVLHRLSVPVVPLLAVGIYSWMPLVVRHSLEKGFSNAKNVVY
jgi:hypothetical protein